MTIKNAINYTSGGTPAEPTTGLFAYNQINYALGFSYGQLKQSMEGTNWDMVALGSKHGLGLKGGYLYSWGVNTSGRTGQTALSGYTYIPTQVGSYSDWWKIAAGYDHSLGIRKTWNTDHYDYTLWVWGEGGQYATGLGSIIDRSSPYQVGTDTDWEDIDAGYRWSCAIKSGVLFTCGQNTAYATGQNTTTGNTTTWTSYDSSTGWAKCFAGYNYGLAIKTNGTLWGWGENGQYNLGTGDTTDIFYPTQIGTDTDWSDGCGGYRTSFMIKTNGTLYGAGYGAYYQFGNGSNSSLTSWTQIGSDTDWQKLKNNANDATSQNSSLAIKNGKLYSCGYNLYGLTGLPPETYGDQVQSWTQIGTFSNCVDIGVSSYGGMVCRQ